jgi:hypothetical protein
MGFYIVLQRRKAVLHKKKTACNFRKAAAIAT